MTPLTKSVRRVTLETYGYGKQARKLVVSLEKGDLVSIRELGRRSKDTARIYDVLWWMKRSKAAKIQMEKLRERKAAKSARRLAQRQRAADRRLE
jgi:flagellar motility protein MotE (MotC chaperone)